MPLNVLFLCTANSSRSIMAEAILNHRAAPAVVAYSAGSHPAGSVRPEALHQLAAARIDTSGLRSKSWDEFAQPNSAQFDYIFTICDNAASESCPLWPGHPIAGHWSVPDPAAVTGSAEKIAQAYQQAFVTLSTRIRNFLSLPHISARLQSL